MSTQAYKNQDIMVGVVPCVERYVFQLPLRLVHWVIFFDILFLSITGYWIGTADLPAGPGGEFQMGWVRYIHTVAGWTLFAALLLRLYLAFAGNEYASWRALIPSRGYQVRHIWDVVRYYTFLDTKYPHADFGHNRLAGLVYVGVYGLILFMVVSGLALHGMAFPIGWQSWLTWPLAFVSAPTLRLMHHLGMWFIWGFAVHHVASVLLVDTETRGGLISGIFSGFKTLPKQLK